MSRLPKKRVKAKVEMEPVKDVNIEIRQFPFYLFARSPLFAFSPLLRFLLPPLDGLSADFAHVLLGGEKKAPDLPLGFFLVVFF